MVRFKGDQLLALKPELHVGHAPGTDTIGSGSGGHDVAGPADTEIVVGQFRGRGVRLPVEIDLVVGPHKGRLPFEVSICKVFALDALFPLFGH